MSPAAGGLDTEIKEELFMAKVFKNVVYLHVYKINNTVDFTEVVYFG